MKRNALLALAGIAGSASATVVVDTFLPTNLYNGSTVWGAYAGIQKTAQRFTSNVTGQVLQIDIALSHVSGGSNMQVRLHNDNAGTCGTTIATWAVSSFGVVSIVNSNPLAFLTNGTNYWVSVRSMDADGMNGWNRALTGSNRMTSFDFNSGWQAGTMVEESAFRLAAVPEPSSLVALALVLAGGALRARRASKRS